MREIRPSGSEGGGLEFNRFSLPLSPRAMAILAKTVTGRMPILPSPIPSPDA